MHGIKKSKGECEYMLQSKWGQSNATRGARTDKDKVTNTGQHQPQKAKVKADNSGDVKQVVVAGRNSFVLPIQFVPKVAIALPAVNAGLQLPILSGSGDAIDDSKVETDDISKRL
jgi:hypothetical protein